MRSYTDEVLRDMAERFSPRTWALLLAVERDNGAMVAPKCVELIDNGQPTPKFHSVSPPKGLSVSSYETSL